MYLLNDPLLHIIIKIINVLIILNKSELAVEWVAKLICWDRSREPVDDDQEKVDIHHWDVILSAHVELLFMLFEPIIGSVSIH